MKIVQEQAVQSGWQARPEGLPSAGRALSVLVAVCAVLWVWLMLPQWWQTGSVSEPTQQRVSQLLFQANVLWPLVIVLNILLLLYATRPMWQGTRLTLKEEVKRGLVLLLCLLFHVFTPPAAVLLSVAILLD